MLRHEQLTPRNIVISISNVYANALSSFEIKNGRKTLTVGQFSPGPERHRARYRCFHEGTSQARFRAADMEKTACEILCKSAVQICAAAQKSVPKVGLFLKLSNGVTPKIRRPKIG